MLPTGKHCQTFPNHWAISNFCKSLQFAHDAPILNFYGQTQEQQTQQNTKYLLVPSLVMICQKLSELASVRLSFLGVPTILLSKCLHKRSNNKL
ncbi:hypothetical protein B0189_08335 [Moraxella cuniculi]|nr:hypothetical protein B0189_08335 [Moraxella cuniculi]